jgi:hypothetical protein
VTLESSLGLSFSFPNIQSRSSTSRAVLFIFFSSRRTQSLPFSILTTVTPGKRPNRLCETKAHTENSRLDAISWLYELGGSAFSPRESGFRSAFHSQSFDCEQRTSVGARIESGNLHADRRYIKHVEVIAAEHHAGRDGSRHVNGSS